MSHEDARSPDDVIRQIAEAGKGVRFGRGVVGKTGHAAIALLALWGVIIWRLGPIFWLDVALLAAGCAATGVFVWWTLATQRFAERNPAQAMLEGAEFLEYKRFEARTKMETQEAKLVIEAGGNIQDRLSEK